jgi:hypothetical protein
MRKLIVSAVAVVVAVALLATFQAEAAPPPPSAFKVGWAVVNVDGTLARGSGAVSSVAVGTDGVYFVTFNRDVRACAYVGAGGEPGNFPPDDAITIGASASDRGNPNEVSVIEYDAILGADSYSSGFHLIVTC